MFMIQIGKLLTSDTKLHRRESTRELFAHSFANKREALVCPNENDHVSVTKTLQIQLQASRPDL
jgi:hypothetical protein